MVAKDPLAWHPSADALRKRLERLVRKLKNFGLTQSFDVGYAVSPRGRAYPARTGRTTP